MRGARDAWAMLSLLRSRIPAADLAAFVRWLPAVKTKVGPLSRTRFPKRIYYVRARPPLQPVPLSREIAWTATLIAEEHELLTVSGWRPACSLEARSPAYEKADPALESDNGRAQHCICGIVRPSSRSGDEPGWEA